MRLSAIIKSQSLWFNQIRVKRGTVHLHEPLMIRWFQGLGEAQFTVNAAPLAVVDRRSFKPVTLFEQRCENARTQLKSLRFKKALDTNEDTQQIVAEVKASFKK